ncbi:MAG: FKBP-type peptidyl-prolyl cis-trans isomerase [Granulosicoccus sp.]
MLVRSTLFVAVLALSACGSESTSTPAAAQSDQTQTEQPPELNPEITTESGLVYQVMRVAEGAKPTANSVVTLDYVGTLTDGTIFDSSFVRGQSATFNLANTIEGFKEGVQLMSVGSRYRFTIPADLGYGDQGTGDVIKPGDTLIFEVELHEINS